ncbi:hypothetical protein C8J56DRAFT_881833 [Mycena floridula]|nr:hypothetical protein C8J56DRAFT_881833 [Mycena floridula]
MSSNFQQNYLRIPVACLNCRNRKVKCERNSDSDICKRCSRFSLQCEVKSVAEQRKVANPNAPPPELVFHHWTPPASHRASQASASTSSQQGQNQNQRQAPEANMHQLFNQTNAVLPGSSNLGSTNHQHDWSTTPTTANSFNFPNIIQQQQHSAYQTTNYRQDHGGGLSMAPQNYSYVNPGRQTNVPSEFRSDSPGSSIQPPRLLSGTLPPVQYGQYRGVCFCQGPQCYCGNR